MLMFRELVFIVDYDEDEELYVSKNGISCQTPIEGTSIQACCDDQVGVQHMFDSLDYYELSFK